MERCRVARTALAWEGSSGRPLTHSPLYRLCHLTSSWPRPAYPYERERVGRLLQ